MTSVKSFTHVLQDGIAPTDNLWHYHVPNLPSSSKTDHARLIKAITLVSNAHEQLISLHMVPAPFNRVIKDDPLHQFLLLSVADFRLQITANTKDGETQPAPARESAEYVARLLKTGVVLNGLAYHFFGHSNSQLKSRSCFLFAASKEVIKEKVEALADFSNMQSVGKKAKRLGLLFSSAEHALELQPERCTDIDDVKLGDYVFTDGCGLIAVRLAKQVAQRKRIVYRNKRYLPSVLQIRYRGYKGVLMIDPTLTGQTQVLFRKSMKKLKDVKDLSFSVVEHSKPYTFGFLNDEIVVLLNALGVSTDTILSKQTEYLQFLDEAYNGEPRAAFRFLSYQNELDLAEKLLIEGVHSVRKSLRSLVKTEYSRMLNKYEEQRCRIMLTQSRLLFGVCDPTGRDGGMSRLPPGTCFVRITLDGDGEPRTLINTEVLVTRNPCLHPGDLQKFRAVDVPEFSHLVDCIVFPIRGSRPSADLMSGGDLDGDKFFVTWDPDIIPKKIAEAAMYPGVKERHHFGEITGDDRAEYFARYRSTSLGKIKNLYLKWARLKGAMSPECQQLNRLFSQCVDGNHVKVPAAFEDPPETPPDALPFILDVLHDAATATITRNTHRVFDNESSPTDILDLISCRDSIAISEFELIQFVLRSCTKTGEDFASFADLFNYAALDDEQKAWVIGQLPPSRHMPCLIKNGLVQSDLILLSEMRKFELHHAGLHWQPVFLSSVDRMARFLPSVCRALDVFHKKLVILRADERLTLMIYVPQKIARASEVQVDASVRVFAIPRSSDTGMTPYKVMPTKVNYRLYCDDTVFQLYETKRANTFVFLTKGPVDTSSYRDTNTMGERRRQKQKTLDEGLNFDCRASVALQKISAQVQKHVGRMNRAGILAAEIYVISNRDVQSMRYLDRWLHFIDTEEKLPNFEPVSQEYRIPTMSDSERSKIPEKIARIVWDHDFQAVEQLTTAGEITHTLQLLHNTAQLSVLQLIYTRLIESVTRKNETTQLCTLRSLLEFLPTAAFLAQSLLDSQLWKLHCQSLAEESSVIFLAILPEFALLSHQISAFVKKPFQTVLRNIKQISVQQLVDLCEIIALTMPDVELALDFLLECLEPEISRILVGRPLEISQCIKQLIGIAIEHIEEANSNRKFLGQTLRLVHDRNSDGFTVVKTLVRIDSPSTALKTGDHIQLVVTESPSNAPLKQPYTMDAVVLHTEQGSARLRCIHRPPSYVQDCAWKYRNCGSFVTSKAMFDAVARFYGSKEVCCPLYKLLVGFPPSVKKQDVNEGSKIIGTMHPLLNNSQNKALQAAMQHRLLFLWGPPGTGKTHTIAIILQNLLVKFPASRILATAPTHNAVDNMLQKFIEKSSKALAYKPLRVATDLSKVSSSLHAFTCDAFVGQDLTDSHSGRRKAQERVTQSRLIFTTCIGAGLGLLRSEDFDIVLVDEASQQTEAETLVPLTKGCRRAILVGDHVQLRATVQKHSVLSGFDVSLFERHYTASSSSSSSSSAKVMLDTQYRMHPDICKFSSQEFYFGRLYSDRAMGGSIRLPSSAFPWPGESRKVFVQCSTSEDLGHQSKSNEGQIALCREICRLLLTRDSHAMKDDTSIAILTPYSRQRLRLSSELPGELIVSSIDGFQGREADIVVFVTVRCNVHYEIGFLKDLRRLNVAVTRARAGIIIIGDRQTLTGRLEDDADADIKLTWRRLLDQCVQVLVDVDG
ncbi:uncharacterized protein MYCFIDRAFT_145022 [Pseudocercospora fijiensis CIRAD86]|uniref:Uncharacterized protein n=1 Tax=Pseudocercospora fijiensis (strain CIRAD86) TaxID=383855 RepID=M3ALM8_PSEFD|nr:uncharacterized protein MYCFIDRAFT_145022 [Pseudocercospora fijiensis CIRAD86]EME78058.1 hypothetical protein MYCFIDRAFT_145022 [Pseudocercospora fijiensis CIRAD86]